MTVAVVGRSADSGDNGTEEPQVRTATILREIVKIAVPNIAGYLLSLINELTNTVFLGHMGNEAALAAVGLGNMMQNCFGLSVGFGIAAGLDTLVSQAYGAQQHHLSAHYLQRCRVIVALQLLWMVPVLWFSEDWLRALHQDAAVARYAGGYNRATVWGLFAIFQFEANRKFLQNQQLATIPAVICGICSLFHVAWCALFVVHFDLGTAGAGYANVVTWWLQFLISCIYLGAKARSMGFSTREVLGLQGPAFKEWVAYLKVSLPATVQMCGEWWFWEICALVVGYMGDVALAAHVSTLNFVAVSFMPAIGFQVSTATLVGNALGANHPRKAKKTAFMCVACNFSTWCLLAVAMVFGRTLLAEAYTSQDNVQKVMERLLCIFAVAGFFDSCQNVMGGALRGLGKQGLAAAVYLVAFYGIMLPLGCVLGFTFKLGVYGLWDCFVLGTGLSFTIFFVLLCRADYRTLAREASERMEREGREAKESQNLLEASLQGQDSARELRA